MTHVNLWEATNWDEIAASDPLFDLSGTMTLGQVALELEISITSVRRRIKSGKLRARRTGCNKALQVRTDDLRRYCRERLAEMPQYRR